MRGPEYGVFGGRLSGRDMNKRYAALLCTAVITSLLSRSNVASRRTSYSLFGVWFGALLGCTGYCFRQPEISFILFPRPTGIWRSIDVGIGRDDCPDPDFGGKVTIPDPESTVLSIHVLRHDESRCLFQAGPRVTRSPETASVIRRADRSEANCGIRDARIEGRSVMDGA